jgi:hypothetical protein
MHCRCTAEARVAAPTPRRLCAATDAPVSPGRSCECDEVKNEHGALICVGKKCSFRGGFYAKVLRGGDGAPHLGRAVRVF